MINSAQSFQLIIEVILVCVGFAFFPLYYWCIKLCSCNFRSQSDARLKTSANWARTLSRALNSLLLLGGSSNSCLLDNLFSSFKGTMPAITCLHEIPLEVNILGHFSHTMFACKILNS